MMAEGKKKQVSKKTRKIDEKTLNKCLKKETTKKSTTNKKTKKVKKEVVKKKETVKPVSEKKKEVKIEVAKPVEKKTKKTEEKKKEIQIEIAVEKKKKTNIGFPILAIFVIASGVFIGTSLYVPVKGKEMTAKDIYCEYGDWEEEHVSYCLVSPEGKYFENDVIRYEKTKNGCIKHTRSKVCKYES